MLAPTLIRRYTPPTCSLEIVAKTSALSQWTGNPVIKELQFELSLDDPRLVNEQKIVLTGDRQQLEDLAEVVSNYVQNFLQQTNPVFDFAPTQNIFTYHTQGSSQIAAIARPQLETKGLLSHRLHLGRLATTASGQAIQLSATQLYDLANALEAYSADMVALPALTATRNRQTVMRWGAIAASFLVVIGVSKTAWQLQQTQQAENAANLEMSESAAPQNDVKLVPPDPHVSYSVTPVPTTTDPRLTASQAAPQQVKLQPSTAPTTPQSSPKPAPAAPTRPSLSPMPVAAPQPLARTALPPDAATEPYTASPEATFDLTASPTIGDRLQQIEDYMQSQWQSPAGLKETLEYRLTLKPDGHIAQVIPIGKAATLYQPQLTFLNTDQAIATPDDQASQTFRLVLDPDGKAQVFDENL